MIGLHTCGDLASTMLRVFRRTPEIVGLVSVSCCYFRLTLQPDLDHRGACTDDSIKTKHLHANHTELETKSNIDNCRCGIPCETFSIPKLYDNYTRLRSALCVDCKKPQPSNRLFTSNEEKESPREDLQTEGFLDDGNSCGPSTDTYGFPLSLFLQRMSRQPLKYKSLETACHFLDDYVQKLFSKLPFLLLNALLVQEIFY